MSLLSLVSLADPFARLISSARLASLGFAEGDLAEITRDDPRRWKQLSGERVRN